MSVVIPTRVVAQILAAPHDEARVAVNRVHSGDLERPTLVLLMSFGGWTNLLDAMEVAIKNAPTPEVKEGWRLLGLKIVQAIQQEPAAVTLPAH